MQPCRSTAYLAILYRKSTLISLEPKPLAKNAGGFGVVYLAEQKQLIRRRVALKFIKLGMDTRQVTAGVKAERQALAGIPNIHE